MWWTKIVKRKREIAFFAILAIVALMVLWLGQMVVSDARESWRERAEARASETESIAEDATGETRAERDPLPREVSREFSVALRKDEVTEVRLRFGTRVQMLPSEPAEYELVTAQGDTTIIPLVSPDTVRIRGHLGTLVRLRLLYPDSVTMTVTETVPKR